MINVKLFLILTFLLIASCVQKTESPVDPSSPSGYFLQNNLCALVKICPPTTDVAPVPGASGVLTLSSIGKTSVTVSWTAATDDKTAQAAIQYLVYYSTKNNITVLADTKANGTAVGSLTANIVTKTITGLTASTTYYFNVIAKDSAGNEVVYVNNNAYTLNDKIVLFSYSSTTKGNVGGRTGADSLCSSSRSSVTIQPNNITCTGIKAFLSFTGDNLINLPTAYGMDTTNPIVSATNVAIASNWNSLFTTNTSNTLIAAGVTTATFWTFTAAGGVVTTNTCLNGTYDTDNSINGRRGDATTSTTPTWYNSGFTSCDTPLPILCVCY